MKGFKSGGILKVKCDNIFQCLHILDHLSQVEFQGLKFFCMRMHVRISLPECLFMSLFQIGIVDPDCRLIGLHLYDGLFKVCFLSRASVV